ncbi:MAG: hypothetical protein K6U11_08575 [bacterium]|nr:hypothetical protein [bacterium]
MASRRGEEQGKVFMTLRASGSFYASWLYEGLSAEEEPANYHEHPVPAEFLDKVLCGSSENMARATLFEER